MAEELKQEGSIQSRWYSLHTQRTAHLNRARECSRLTIPALLPEEHINHKHELPTPYQSLGAKAVNNLASKIWLALLPPNHVFFRLSLAPDVEQELDALQQQMDISKADIEERLGEIEKKILNEVDSQGIRNPAFRAFRQLVVTGNTLIYIPPKGKTFHKTKSNKKKAHKGMKVFRLDQYVVSRDQEGNLLELIVKESTSVAALPGDVRERVSDKLDNKLDLDKEADLFTRVWLEGGKYQVEQEVEKEKIPQSTGEYDPEELPWRALRWTSDEEYGRGPVEEYLGDLYALESLSQAIIEGSLAAAKVVFLVNPNGVTREKTLAQAKNCDFKPGVGDDVSIVRVDKAHDFQIAQSQLQALEQRLAQAFLMNTAIQREAERVTAEEIRYMAQELEDTLGGVYSMQAKEFQLPLVQLMLKNLKERKVIPELPEDAIQVMVTTGLEALGRNHEQARLREFLAEAGQTLGQEMLAKWINPHEYLKRAGTNYGIETGNLLRTPDEVQAMQDQEGLAQAGQDSAPKIAQEVTKGVMQDGQQQPGPAE